MSKSTIRQLKTRNYTNPADRTTTTITDEKDILTEIHTYYSHLSTKLTLNEGLQDELLSHIKRTLPLPTKRVMDADITSAQLEDAIKLTKRDRSPGTSWPRLSHDWPTTSTRMDSSLPLSSEYPSLPSPTRRASTPTWITGGRYRCFATT